MLKYNNPIYTEEGYTLSIDKVRLVFRFKTERDSLVFRLNMLNNYKTDAGKNIAVMFAEKMYSAISVSSGRDFNLTDADFYKARPDFTLEEFKTTSCKFGTYRYMYTIHPIVNCKDTIVVAHQLNNGKDTQLDGFIEFNPNKTAGEVLVWILKTLRLHCSYLILKRYDLALDVPVIASSITLHKDERKYELHRPSQDSAKDTEYLGARNEVGRFKKYNKKVEHNLRSDADNQIEEEITRLELTLNSFEYSELCRLFPKIEVMKSNINLFDHIDYVADFDNLSSTDKVLVKLLLESDKKDQYFNELGRDKKNKLRPFLYEHFKQNIVIREKDFNKCISQMLDYLQLFNTNAPNKLIR